MLLQSTFTPLRLSLLKKAFQLAPCDRPCLLFLVVPEELQGHFAGECTGDSIAAEKALPCKMIISVVNIKGPARFISKCEHQNWKNHTSFLIQTDLSRTPPSLGYLAHRPLDAQHRFFSNEQRLGRLRRKWRAENGSAANGRKEKMPQSGLLFERLLSLLKF